MLAKHLSFPREAAFSVCIVLFDGFSLGALSTIVEALRVANYLAAREAYSPVLISSSGGNVASNGFGQVTTAACDDISPAETDIIIICDKEESSPGERDDDSIFTQWLTEMCRQKVRICAMGAAVFRLAAQGMLDKQEAVVPWFDIDVFEHQFPQVPTRNALMELNQPIMTCAGGMATLDFMLHFFVQSTGLALAAKVADYMVYEDFREPNAAQRPLAASLPKSVDVKTTEFVSIAGKDPLRAAEDIAAMMKISRRHLERICCKDLKCSPARFLQISRLQRSRSLLRLTDKSIQEISAECGFVSQSHFTQRYKAHFGRTPRSDRTGPIKASQSVATQVFMAGAIGCSPLCG